MLKRISILLIALTSLFSCKEKFDPLEFEKQVAYEVFPQLMDSIHRDTRVAIPPPTYIRDTDGNVIALDTIEFEKRWDQYELRKKKYYKDSVNLFLAIRDSAFLLKENDEKSFLKFYEDDFIELGSTSISSQYKIRLNKLKASNNIRFKYLSEFPEGTEIWRQKEKYDFFLNAATGFSRIRFDKTYSFGVLTSNYSMGMLDGFGVRVFIRKVKGKWIIDEIHTTSIS